MAPTGRAAKRLEEQTGEPASTIHRALETNFRAGISGILGSQKKQTMDKTTLV